MAEPRVIFVNRVYWQSTSATAQLLTDLAEGLAARDWDVHVVTAGDTAERYNGVFIHRTGTPEHHGGLLSRVVNHRHFLRAARRQLMSLLQPGDVVVALTDPPMLGAMVAAVAAIRGAKLIHWIQDIYPEIAAVHFGAIAGAFLSPLKLRRDRAWRQAVTCVTLGEDMAGVVASRGVEASRLQILPNWAPRELHEPAPPEDVADRRREWDCSDKFVVAYSGNLGRVHEFATLLDAATLLRDEPAVVFLFIGHGARFAELEAGVRQRGLTNVRLLAPEPRSTLTAALASPDAHCVTLLPEYGRFVYPSKLAGVLAAGRPVIFVGPPGGDIARLLRTQDCGAAFAPGDAPALAAMIRYWHAQRELSEPLGTRAREAYEAMFAAETALDRWDALLRKTAGRT